MDEIEILPTSATCQLIAIDGHSLGIEPRVIFELNVECKPDEESGPISVSADWVSFPGQSWKELDKIQIAAEECFLEADSPELSIYLNSVHWRMGQLTLRVSPLENHFVEVHLEATEDVDGLGRDSFSLDAHAQFLGVHDALSSQNVSVKDLIDMEGLELTDARTWTPPKI